MYVTTENLIKKGPCYFYLKIVPEISTDVRFFDMRKFIQNKKAFQWDAYCPPPLDVTPGDPQVNMFEQVSSDHHQMSLKGDVSQV